MFIANPIYDSVFKYLLDDLEIAKGLLSLILEEEIVELNFQPEETRVESPRIFSPSIIIYRLDFKAVIKTKEGKYEKILIELQKTRRNSNIMRFRNYLADNYIKKDGVLLNKGQKEVPLPIVTIYFLGFKLANILTPILKVCNTYYDIINKVTLKKKPKEPFILLLNHESYTIQIPRLPADMRSELEEILSVFKQENINIRPHLIDYTLEHKKPLHYKVVQRLIRAVADADMLKRMRLEDEMEDTLDRELAEKEDIIAEQKELIEQKDNALLEKDNELEEMRKMIAKLQEKSS